jgi:hypothetical protein
MNNLIKFTIIYVKYKLKYSKITTKFDSLSAPSLDNH